MSSDAQETLNSLIIPLNDETLLLPNVAVAELVGYRITRPAPPGAPQWFLGWSLWREQQVPMVDFEAMQGQPLQAPEGIPRGLVLNALGGRPGISFIGLRVGGIPRSRRVQRGELSAHGEASVLSVQSVRLADDALDMLIPDLPAIEQLLDEHQLLRPPAA
ncbi:chemotaxis protein CheW [Halopseudomonas yangmingensis]|uniref:Chemosensory pili system protein ChpC n=1 Tax=Halopseudomonas yangmingensis TaxID=1720063 RepID=A0A1I4RZH6_9GAMM|nr:chemotaxis protein CheW [Halopseudomonas yangmingensis]SFM57390.1 chemosensory pili system protein ChpC [Halopseudomonas yangmingensis]